MRITKTKNVILDALCHRCKKDPIRHIVTLYDGLLTIHLALCDRCAALPPGRIAWYALSSRTDSDEYLALKSMTSRNYSQQARFDELEPHYPYGK